MWVRGECLHYSLVTGKTQLELTPLTADRFTLRGAHGMQLQMAAGTSGARDLALLAFQHLYQVPGPPAVTNRGPSGAASLIPPINSQEQHERGEFRRSFGVVARGAA